jgi:hypothetical protein
LIATSATAFLVLALSRRFMHTEASKPSIERVPSLQDHAKVRRPSWQCSLCARHEYRAAIRCGIAALLRIGRWAFTCDSRFVGPAEMLQFPFSLRAMRSMSSRTGLEVTGEGRLMQGRPMRAVADRVIGFGLRSHPATSKRFRHDQTAMRRRTPSDGRDCRRLAAIRARPKCLQRCGHRQNDPLAGL